MAEHTVRLFAHTNHEHALRGKDSNSTRQLDRQPKTPRHRQMGQGLSRPRKNAGSGAPILSELSAKAWRRDGPGAYIMRRGRLYDTCTHPRNAASARRGVFFRGDRA